MLNTSDDLSPRQRLWNASRSARRLLSGERPVTPAERLTALARSANGSLIEPLDLYNTGMVERVEERVATLLGKAAAAWFPTGIMAQQSAFRVWAARTETNRVAVHPLHHTQLNEEDASTALSGLEPVDLTGELRQPTADDLHNCSGPLAAVVAELPMQELGYVLPTWEEYVQFSAEARERAIPLHVDGARIWEAQHHFARPLTEIAAHASSIYVSMYKGIGGLGGALIAADADVIEEVRLWRTRYGGNLFQQFPSIIAALDGLDTRLDRMPMWTQHAKIIADGLADLPGLTVTPNPPHINEFWVYADRRADLLNRAVLEHLEQSGERWLHGWWTDSSGRSVAEVTVRDEAMAWTAIDVAKAGHRILDHANRMSPG